LHVDPPLFPSICCYPSRQSSQRVSRPQSVSVFTDAFVHVGSCKDSCLRHACGMLAACLRHACGMLAACLRRACGVLAACLRRACGVLAACLRRACGVLAAHRTSSDPPRARMAWGSRSALNRLSGRLVSSLGGNSVRPKFRLPFLGLSDGCIFPPHAAT
jgi:hypothetical protein